MSTEDGQESPFKIDKLLCFVVFLLIALVMNDQHLLAILFVLGLILIELMCIRQAIEDKP